jgi:hypothetical protein
LKWYYGQDLKKAEIQRIEKRFYKEIVLKLEAYTHTQAQIGVMDKCAAKSVIIDWI